MKKIEKIRFYAKKKAKEDKLFDDIIRTYEKGGLKFEQKDIIMDDICS